MSLVLYNLTKSGSILKSWSKNSFGTITGSVWENFCKEALLKPDIELFLSPLILRASVPVATSNGFSLVVLDIC